MNPGVVAQVSRHDLLFVAARSLAVFVWMSAARHLLLVVALAFDSAMRRHLGIGYLFESASLSVGLTLIGTWAWFNAERLASSPVDPNPTSGADDTVIFTRETLLHGVLLGLGTIQLVRGLIVLIPFVLGILGLQPMNHFSTYSSAGDFILALYPAPAGIALLLWVSKRTKKLGDDYIIE